MDPDVAIRHLVEALERSDVSEAREAFDALVDWLDKGGFSPMFRLNQRELQATRAALRR